MDLRIEDVSPVEKKLIVEVPWATVNTKLTAAFKELGKNVQLKGFRRGKVSRAVLERMFGKRVRAEVAADLVRESFITATTEHSLEAVSEPQIDVADLVIKKGQAFAFEAIVEVRGEVKAESYTGMEIHKVEGEVSDQDLEHAISHLQREHTELLPIEDRDTLGEKDICMVKVNGEIGEVELENREMTVDLSDDQHETYPGLVAALIGAPLKAEGHPITITFPEDYGVSDVAGITAELTVDVIDAREQSVPALDDEFAVDTGKAETMDELREVVRGELEARLAEEIKSDLQKNALAELVKRNPIPLASSLIDRAAEHKYRQLQMMLGIDPKSGDGPPADIRDRLRDSAADEVRGQLLLEAIADAESIEVTDEELEARIANIAEIQNAQPARLRAEMERDGRIDNLKFSLRQDKVLDFLIDKAVLVDPPEEPEGEGEVTEGEAAESPASGDEEE
jgi:trigger factor